MPLSNAEKQARFRQKEEFKRDVEAVRHELKVNINSNFSAPDAPSKALEKLVDLENLPPSWTQNDLEAAYRRLNHIRFSAFDNENEIDVAVFDGLEQKGHFRRKAPFDQRKAELDEEVAAAKALAAHLIGAIELTTLNEASRSAAAVETLRHVGKAAADSPDLEMTDPTTMSLLSTPSYYSLPDWFLGSLASLLAKRFEHGDRAKLAEMLVNDVSVSGI
ncbi:hypothetical protein [Shimia abyssi]|uniref:Uncharacterized protein n=1 Tax=Shimia abyssi TaxID=1662395 RepID=A0A2P8FFN1_9RHOB|nr:hypothetical protein [Shimia abyssi]PSL20526.1 hypothetical protein CLV88_103173 [Shimia abyssi]